MDPILWILLALAGGFVAFCFAKLLRLDDEIENAPNVGEDLLHSPDAWARFSRAHKRYEASLEDWMTPEEIAARQDCG